MTRIATMGTASCATFSLAGFKDEDVLREKEYIKDPTSFNASESVEDWYNQILFPTDQELGQTGEYPFSCLMEEINTFKGETLKGKFIILTINSYQYNKDDKFWPKRFEHWGFELMDKTQNNIGQSCYIFVRNLSRKK